MGKKIMVTGGTGYIGSHTVVELQLGGHEVLVLDNLSNSRERMLDQVARITGKRPLFEKIDLCDLPGLKAFFKVHDDLLGVIHFAALKAVGESVQQPLRYYHNNLVSLLNLLSCMDQSDSNPVLCLFFILHSIRAAGAPPGKRAGAREGSGIPLREYQADLRGDYQGPLRGLRHAGHFPAVFQPDRGP
jgi:nucleoside-diphosphate-sugar epimerase